MAVAGKAAITLDGAWSDKKDYDRLTGVTYNNSLFISRKKPPIGTAPSEGEYWMLCIEGVNEQDLDALAARVIDIENGIDDYGTADISEIGDGTVKGAISEINNVMPENGKQVKDITQITESGMYNSAGDCPNAPVNDGGYYNYIASKHGLLVNIIAISNSSDATVYSSLNKTEDGTTWTNSGWHKIANADEYLPLTGGTLTGALSFDGYGYFAADSNEMAIVTQQDKDFTKRRVLSIKNASSDLEYATIMYDSITNKNYNIFGEHNKPSGSYTGNGSATQRTIDIGGIGSFLILANSGGATVIVSWQGAIAFNPYTSTINYFNSDVVNFNNGKLNMLTDNANVNYSGSVYEYHVI